MTDRQCPALPLDQAGPAAQACPNGADERMGGSLIKEAASGVWSPCGVPGLLS